MLSKYDDYQIKYWPSEVSSNPLDDEWLSQNCQLGHLTECKQQPNNLTTGNWSVFYL